MAYNNSNLFMQLKENYIFCENLNLKRDDLLKKKNLNRN